jgi:hypothetical protein
MGAVQGAQRLFLRSVWSARPRPAKCIGTAQRVFSEFNEVGCCFHDWAYYFILIELQTIIAHATLLWITSRKSGIPNTTIPSIVYPTRHMLSEIPKSLPSQHFQRRLTYHTSTIEQTNRYCQRCNTEKDHAYLKWVWNEGKLKNESPEQHSKSDRQ